jgi:hypothetical protein
MRKLDVGVSNLVGSGTSSAHQRPGRERQEHQQLRFEWMASCASCAWRRENLVGERLPASTDIMKVR